MAECGAVRERFPDLLVGAVSADTREQAHLHIESCDACSTEWKGLLETWRMLGTLPDVPVPEVVRRRFDESLRSEFGAAIVPFSQRRSIQWLSRAAVVLLIAAGSFMAGNRFGGETPTPPAVPKPALVATSPYSIAERLIVPASQVSPEILGSPDIRNLSVLESTDGSDLQVSFDITSSMTITGNAGDEALTQLLSYVVQNENNPSHSRSRVIQWVKDAYGDKGVADASIVRALANVLANDTHEGVRIKAVDALMNLPAELAPDATEALMRALQNDPNPAVRMKAVDALANLSTKGSSLDSDTLEILRQKAEQLDENPYVRVKAAEVLSQIDL